MKTLFVYSDTHNEPVPKSLENIMAESDYVIFCGDGIEASQKYLNTLNGKFYAVKGNCDLYSEHISNELILNIEGVKVLAVHGHNERVKSSPMELLYRAEEVGAKLVLYGHTHRFEEQTVRGVRLVNVGSLGMSFLGENGYCYIIIDKQKILVKFVKTY